MGLQEGQADVRETYHEPSDAEQAAAHEDEVEVHEQDALVPGDNQVVNAAHHQRGQHGHYFGPRVRVLARQRKGQAHQGAARHEEKGHCGEVVGFDGGMNIVNSFQRRVTNQFWDRLQVKKERPSAEEESSAAVDLHD